ncbi:MAG: ubiquinone anaerobic biosynthesis accessory factor UbiT [Pseudomonadota bacterium]
MMETEPRFSPAWLAGMALRPFPPAWLQPGLDAAMAALRRRHPSLFAWLASLGDRVFRIEPVELPLAFLLTPGARPPRLVAVRPDEAGSAPAATIRAPLALLLALLEGRLDGDALFFRRDLVIEGDMAVVLALRNAIENAEIRLTEDLPAVMGPFAPPLRAALDLARRLHGAAARDLAAVQAALLAPVEAELALLRRQVGEVAEELAISTRHARRSRRPAESGTPGETP